jgi:thiamine transport system permease protein
MPALLTAGALIFLFTFTSFGVILILGGLSYATLEVEIYQQTVGLFNLSVASALSALQLLSTLALSLAYSVLQARYNRPRPLQASQTLQQAPRTWAAKLWVGVNLGVLALVTLAPLLALVERSLWLGEGWGLAYYTALDENRRGSLIFVTPLEAIQNSLRIACVVTLLALVLGTLAAYGVAGRGRVARVLDALYLLPLATSAVTLGFGYVLAFSSPPTAWRASFWLIPAAHTLVALPFVLRSILPSLRAIRPSLRGAAASLGAGVWARFRLIELPLLGRGLLVGGIFAFTVSMGEFGASAFIARPQAPTLPIAIFRLLGQPGSANYGQALALSVLLLLTCALAFWAMERLGRAITGGF